jgi:hypothetical protein
MCIFVLFVKQVHIKKNIDGSLVVYAILLSWPEQPVQKLGVPIPSPVTLVSMLRFPNVINWNFGPENKGIYIELKIALSTINQIKSPLCNRTNINITPA